MQLKDVKITISSDVHRLGEALKAIGKAATSASLPLANSSFIPPAFAGVLQDNREFMSACADLATKYNVDQKTAAERLALISRQTIPTWRYWIHYFKLNDGWVNCPESELLEWAERTRLEELARMIG